MGIVVALIFVGALIYLGRAAPLMARESGRALDAFYLRCQTHDYARAYALFTPELRESLSEKELIARWREFEQTNGPIQKWAPAAGGSINFGGRVCIVPPFVDYTHKIIGQKPATLAMATVVYIRMVPRNGAWQLQKLSFMR